jgi:hypothetical protein
LDHSHSRCGGPRVEVGRANPGIDAAPAKRRETGRGDQLACGFRARHPGHQHARSACIQRCADQGRIVRAHPGNRDDTTRACSENQRTERLDPVGAVLHVEDHDIEAGEADYLDDLHRGDDGKHPDHWKPLQ